MQAAAPDIIRFDQETASTQRLYGLDQKETRTFGEQLLAARRFRKRRPFHPDHAWRRCWGQGPTLKPESQALGTCDASRPSDRGIASGPETAGMLDETLVVFATEFGRTPGYRAPMAATTIHTGSAYGWLEWNSRGITHGQTDEIGFHAVESPHYVTDVHATLLHQRAPPRLHEGHQRLEEDFGHVIHEISVVHDIAPLPNLSGTYGHAVGF